MTFLCRNGAVPMSLPGSLSLPPLYPLQEAHFRRRRTTNGGRTCLLGKPLRSRRQEGKAGYEAEGAEGERATTRTIRGSYLKKG